MCDHGYRFIYLLIDLMGVIQSVEHLQPNVDSGPAEKSLRFRIRNYRYINLG